MVLVHVGHPGSWRSRQKQPAKSGRSRFGEWLTSHLAVLAPEATSRGAPHPGARVPATALW